MLQKRTKHFQCARNAHVQKTYSSVTSQKTKDDSIVLMQLVILRSTTTFLSYTHASLSRVAGTFFFFIFIFISLARGLGSAFNDALYIYYKILPSHARNPQFFIPPSYVNTFTLNICLAKPVSYFSRIVLSSSYPPAVF